MVKDVLITMEKNSDGISIKLKQSKQIANINYHMKNSSAVEFSIQLFSAFYHVFVLLMIFVFIYLSK
jgi:hypothetical protein